MVKAYERLLKCYDDVKGRMPFTPKVALVLGSGLGDYADQFQEEAIIEYNEIEGFPVSTVSGHKGRFVFAYINEVPVVMMQGRVHYYEGYPMEDVVLPTRLMKMMGAEVLFLTNAAGGVNVDYSTGDLMLITDQIANFVPSPLIGPNIDELGERFSDMSKIYNPELQEIIRTVAKEQDMKLQEGVYVQFSGPNFESPMEVKMCRLIGGDAVGMSTACEAMVANHMGMKICGISLISNMACGILDQPLSHEEVQETADATAPIFKKLVTDSITKIGKN